MANDNGSTCHKASEVMILNSNVLGPRSELRGLGNCYTIVVIFPNCALEYWLSRGSFARTFYSERISEIIAK